MKETGLPGQSVAPLLQLPCTYCVNPIAKHGQKVGSGLEKGIRGGKRKEMVVLGLLPKPLLQVEKCQKLHHLGTECWRVANPTRARCGDGIGESLHLKTHPVRQRRKNSGTLEELSPTAYGEVRVGPALAQPAPPPETRLGPFPPASHKCFMRCAETTYVSRTHSLLGDRRAAYGLVGCTCFTTTYLCWKSEDMLPSPSSIFNL